MTEYTTEVREILYTIREKETGIITGMISLTPYGATFEPSENAVFRAEDLKKIASILECFEKTPIGMLEEVKP